MGARDSSQRSFGLVDQLPHDVGYEQGFFDSSGGLSRPNQRFSTLSAAEPFDNFRPKRRSLFRRASSRLLPHHPETEYAGFARRCRTRPCPVLE